MKITTFVAALGLATTLASGSAKGDSCYIVTSWSPEDCGHPKNVADCARGWGAYVTYEECCEDNWPGKGCKNDPQRPSTKECYIVTNWNPETCGLVANQTICERGWDVFATQEECCQEEFGEACVGADGGPTECYIVTGWNPETCGLVSDKATCGRGWGTYETEEACCQKEFGNACDGSGGNPPVDPEPVPTDAPVDPEPVPTDPPVDPEPVPTDPPVDPEPVPTDPPVDPEPVPTDAPEEIPEITKPDGGVDIPDGEMPDTGVPQNLVKTLINTKWDDVLVYLVSEDPLVWERSTIYHETDLIKATLQMGIKGIGDMSLYLGETDDEDGYKYGAAAVAAFLAQCMKETIMYNACDENNWDMATPTASYVATNACGQLGQSYEDYTTSEDMEFTTCKTKPEKYVVATTHATWWGAPPAFFAAPKSMVPEGPKWNFGGWCDSSLSERIPDDYEWIMSIPAGESLCRMYDGQQAGYWEWCTGGCPNAPAPSFGKDSRYDVEGCYWWGRGVIQTTGVANFGLLNWHTGKHGASENKDVMFPDIDFCETPEEICTSTKYPELKWIAGYFYWLNNVQTYDAEGWNYFDQLKKFVDTGMNTREFIDGVSGIVNRGCHNPPNCGTGELDGGDERAKNFETVLIAMGLL